MSVSKEINMRCDCGAEMVSFIKHVYNDGEFDYELNFEDAYCGGDYMGIKGRFKRAWRAFWAKPVYYTGVYCEDGKRMREFLEGCLRLMDKDGRCKLNKKEMLNFGYGEDDADCWCE